MEIYIFLVFGGLFLAFIFLAIGIVIGRISVEGINKGQHIHNNNNDVLNGNIKYMCNSPVGDIHE